MEGMQVEMSGKQKIEHDVSEELLDDSLDEKINMDEAEEESWFAPLDEKKLAMVNDGGKRRSRASEKWAQNCFDEWRTLKSMDTTKSIRDLFEEAQGDGEKSRAFVKALKESTLQVRKKDKSFYPPVSIQGLLRGINRLMRHRQDKSSREIGIPHVLVNILTDAIFAEVKTDGDCAVSRSRKAGLGKTSKKSNILTLGEENTMLLLPQNRADNPHGANRHFAWYCTKCFFVRASQELRNLNVEDFTLLKLPGGNVLRFWQGESKNWQIDVTQCGVNQQRLLVDCHTEDVLHTFKMVSEYRPVYNAKDIASGPKPLFLTPLRKNFNEKVWYTKQAVGVNTLGAYMKKMTKMMPELKDKIITNKTDRVTGITRMEEAKTPIQFGMQLLGHRDPKSYTQYNKGEKSLRDRAMQRIIAGELKDGKLLTYEEAFEEELNIHDTIQTSDIDKVKPFNAIDGNQESSSMATSILSSKQTYQVDDEDAFWHSDAVMDMFDKQMKRYQEKQAQLATSSSTSGHTFRNVTNCPKQQSILLIASQQASMSQL